MDQGMVTGATLPGFEGQTAMNVLQLQLLTQLASGSKRQDADEFDDIGLVDGDADASGSMRTGNGSVRTERVMAFVKRNPEKWIQMFEAMLKKKCFGDVSRRNPSLFDYVLDKMRFARDQEDVVRFSHMLAAMFALHREGEDTALGALIVQCFKSVE